MNTNAVAFFIGLFGSIHCVGMCGPLALSIPSFHQQAWRLIADKFLYNIGRILVYTFLGYLIGFAGKALWMNGLQQDVSLLTGLLIIAAGFSRIFKFSVGNSRLVSSAFAPVNRALGYAIRHRYGHFMLGMLNGFLPCGFVYLALAGAVNTSSPISATQYMFWFGLGTFPLMLIAMLSTGFAGPLFRRRINRAMPYLMICLGFWFVLRGLSLGIPYLSPAPVSNSVICR